MEGMGDRYGSQVGLAVALVTLLALASPASSATIEVKNQKDSGKGSLRKALADANPADVVKVPRGDYELKGPLVIDDAIEVKGAGPSKTVIDAQKKSRVFEVAAGPTGISKLAITRGKELSGGGISSSADLTLERVLVARNKAKFGGGGIFTSAGLTVNNSEITRNKAVNNAQSGRPSGGAIFSDGATGPVDIVKSTISRNVAKAPNDYALGGAIHLAASGSDPSGLIIDRSTLADNTATGERGAGGAIYFTPFVFEGGNIPLEITSSTLSGNRTLGDTDFGFGGAIYFAPIASGAGSVSRFTLGNSTVANNVNDAGDAGTALGGGVYVGALVSAGGSSPQAIAHSTIAGNEAIGTAATDGGGLMTENVGGAMPGVVNSIISDNESSLGDDNCGEDVESSGGNLEDGTTCDFTHPDDITPSDPLLRALRDNGGPTSTMALHPNSPAVDSAQVAFCLPLDQRGIVRPQGTECDIGAFELVDP